MGDLAIRIVIARWPVKARSPVKESDKNHMAAAVVLGLLSPQRR
eukprot:COSAG01_NODE_1503_length_10093_cov_8.276010_5_plen_44_part_00